LAFSSFHAPVPCRATYSFPTRRSSDLDGKSGALVPVGALVIDELVVIGTGQCPQVIHQTAAVQKCMIFQHSGNLPQIIYTVCHRSEEHTSELQSRFDLVCRLLLEKKKK